MTQIAIRVKNISKEYRLGQLMNTYRTLRETITERVKNSRQSTEKDNSIPNSIWALRNVSFDVNQGQVLGVVGRNGAGKSTLLKILSRVTEPTEGSAEIHGRVGSLLEVGTGFHP